MKAHSEIFLALPLREAWSRFLDAETLPRWVEGLESVRPVKGRREAPGDRTVMTIIAEGRRLEGMESIVRLQPFSVLVTRLEHEDVSATVESTFQEEPGGGTRLTCSARIRPRNLGLGLMANSLLRRVQARQDRDLQRFKALVEGGKAPGPEP